MRLEVTRKSDLAVRALQVLAARGQCKGPEVAEEVGATVGFLPQVLQPLVQKGWVTSEPGPTGGYSLTVDVAEVSVLEVIEVIEGPTDSGQCVLADRKCNARKACALHVPWQSARDELLRELASVRVSEVRIPR